MTKIDTPASPSCSSPAYTEVRCRREGEFRNTWNNETCRRRLVRVDTPWVRS